jgi:Divergent InlB B-repeat domain
MRGAALTFGGLVVASLLVAVVVLLFRWMWPSGNILTVERPTGGTVSGAGLECGTRGSDCTVTRPTDDTVTLQTTPDTGFVFSGFTGDCAPSGRVLMSQPRSCGATFGPVGVVDSGAGGRPMRTLTILKPTGGTIVGEGISCGTLNSVCSAAVPDGTAVTLNIQPDPGYQFEQFTGDCSAEGTVTMSASRTCGVSFGKPPVPIATAVRRPDPPARADPTRGVDSGRPPTGRSGTQSSTPQSSPQGGTGQTITPGQSTTPSATPTGSTPAGVTPGLTGSVTSAQSEAQKVPTAEITADAHARKEITQLVNRYCSALETLQPNRLKELYPQVDVNTYRELFKGYKSLKCSVVGTPEFENLDASPAGFAQIKAEMKQQVEMKTGGAPKLQELIFIIRVSRLSNNSPWMIERMQAGLKPK